MMEGSVSPLFKQTKKFDKDPKENKIDQLCKQVENLHLMIMKSPGRLRSRQNRCATSVASMTITRCNVVWSKDLRVMNAVEKVIALLNVA